MKKIGGQIEYIRPKKDEIKVEISPSLSKSKMNMLALWGGGLDVLWHSGYYFLIYLWF